MGAQTSTENNSPNHAETDGLESGSSPPAPPPPPFDADDSDSTSNSVAIDIYEADDDANSGSDAGESYDTFNEDEATFAREKRHRKHNHRHRNHDHRRSRRRSNRRRRGEKSKTESDSDEGWEVSSILSSASSSQSVGSWRSSRMSSAYSHASSAITSAASSILFDANGNPIVDPYADITCSDTDCSWISEDSDYSSIFSLFEEDMEPTKWMVKFNKWVRGGDIYDDGREEEEEKEKAEGGSDSDGAHSVASDSSDRSSLLVDDPAEESKSEASSSGTCSTPSKYAVVKGADESTIPPVIEEKRSPIIRMSYRRQVPEADAVESRVDSDLDSEEDRLDANVGVGASDEDCDLEVTSHRSSPVEVDPVSPRSRSFSKPETERASQFSQVQRRFLHREMLPVRTPSELELDAAETEEMKPVDPAIHMQRTESLPQPGSVEWRELTRAAKAAWRSWGWNHENWNDIIKKRAEATERQRNLKAWRKEERKYRRRIRKDRRKNRDERRKIREDRKRRNRRGGRVKDAILSSSGPSDRDRGDSGIRNHPETAEVLIKRIMARAKREQEERDRKAAEDNAVRHAAKLAAIGIDPSAMGADADKKPKVEEVDFDLEMRERPWNSRSHADRSDILYRSLYRPFTKNV